MHQVTDHMSTIPPVDLERMVPRGDAILVKRIFLSKTQPHEQERWSREFLLNRLKAHGAYFGAALGEIGIVSPTSSATYMFIPVDPGTIAPRSNTAEAPETPTVAPMEEAFMESQRKMQAALGRIGTHAE